MKIGQRAEKQRKVTRTEKNQQKRTFILVAILIVTVLLIAWVAMIGRKAEQTISVVMLSQDVYKNQAITADMLVEYPMLKAEYEKYAVENEDGSKKRRIVLWSEADKIIGTFAAYPLQENTVAMYNNFIKSRIDNSDSVLYSFPGKTIVSIDVGAEDLSSYKTFLEPGDRVNITAIYTSSNNVELADGSNENIETVRTESVFTDVMLADLLNNDGESILDIYESYNDMTVYQQAQLDNSADFKERTTPTSLLLALTPEEINSYYYYRSMNCEFKMSLPQRTE